MSQKAFKCVSAQQYMVSDDEDWRSSFVVASYADHLAEMQEELLRAVRRQGGMVTAEQSDQLEWIGQVLPEFYDRVALFDHVLRCNALDA